MRPFNFVQNAHKIEWLKLIFPGIEKKEMPNIVCPFCDKEFKLCNFAKHCMIHKESIVKQMSKEQKDWIKENKIPLLKVYETRINPENPNESNQKELFIYCVHCRKYSCNESTRKNSISNFWKEHIKSECVNEFDKYAAMYDLNKPTKKVVNRRTIKINAEIEIEDDCDKQDDKGNEELINKLFEMLGVTYDPEDYDADATTEDALVIEMETLIAGRDLWKSRYEKLKAIQKQS